MESDSISTSCFAGLRERGSGRFSLLLAVAFTAALVYLAFLVIPPCLANFELQDAMRNEVLFAYTAHKPESQIRDEIFRDVKRLGIPAQERDIQVQWSVDGLRVSLKYDVPLNLPGMRYALTFHPHAFDRLM